MSQTLAGPAVFEEVIERSRFLARAWPIEDVDQALAHVADCAREEASHHCWAYRHGQQYRFHDANEPAGTAGRSTHSDPSGHPPVSQRRASTQEPWHTWFTPQS